MNKKVSVGLVIAMIVCSPFGFVTLAIGGNDIEPSVLMASVFITLSLEILLCGALVYVNRKLEWWWPIIFMWFVPVLIDVVFTFVYVTGSFEGPTLLTYIDSMFFMFPPFFGGFLLISLLVLYAWWYELKMDKFLGIGWKRCRVCKGKSPDSKLLCGKCREPFEEKAEEFSGAVGMEG